jgi:hypothetical protein
MRQRPFFMSFLFLVIFAAVLGSLAYGEAGLNARPEGPMQTVGGAVSIQESASVPISQASAKGRTKEEQEYLDRTQRYLKSYPLKYISAGDFMNIAKSFGFEGSASGNTISVFLTKEGLVSFEDLIKKFDVEKKLIRFQFFPVIAFREQPNRKDPLPEGTAKIANKELRTVLDEVAKLWNFHFFMTDNPSFLAVREGADSNSFQLVSRLSGFNLTIVGPLIRGEKTGERNIYIKQIRLNMAWNFTTLTPIDSQDLSFRENGYLVVGVGGTGNLGGDAVILVVSAEIK